MLLVNDVVGALLTVHRQLAICELIAGLLMMSGDPSWFENGKREPWEPGYVDLVGS